MTLSDNLVVVDTAATDAGPRHSRLNPLAAVISVLVIGIAATVVGAVWALEPKDDGLLLTGDDGTVTRIDARTGEPRFSLSDSVVAPDGSTVYRVEKGDGRPTVQLIDPESGGVESEQEIPALLEVRVVGLNGTAAVLTPAGQGRHGLYSPTPRETTDFTVVWKDGRAPKPFHLEGNFEPETFTVDGSVLYLLQFEPATDPDHYSVRQLNLDTGEISDVYSPGVELNPEMRGHARAQALHPDGTFMYTLYTVGDGESLTDDAGDVRYGFVHVISLEENWSFCIFLPVPMGQKESAMGVTMDPDGEHLYVADSEAQMIAEIDPDEMVVTRNVTMETPFPDSYSRAPMAVSTKAGRLFLAGNSAVFAVDTDTLQPVLGWVSPQSEISSIDDIRISDDATELWVLTGRKVIVIGLSEMNVIREIKAPLPGGQPGFVEGGGDGAGFESIDNFFCAC